jgi:hypothetical protein
MKAALKIVTSILLVTIILLSFTSTQIAAKKLTQYDTNQEKTQNTELKTTQSIESKKTNINLLKNTKELSLVSTYPLTFVFIAALVFSFMFDVGILDVIMAGIKGFIFGLLSWPIIGPIMILASPVIGLQTIIETQSILAGMGTTIFSVIFGLTLPVSLSLVSFLAMLSLMVESGPIWWY